MNKRGLNVLVGAVLLILLVVGSIGVVWFFVGKSGEKVGGLQTDCFKVQLRPLSCELFGYCSYTSGKTGLESEVVVRRGADEADLQGLRFLFKERGVAFIGDRENYRDVDAEGLIGPLETRNIRDFPVRIKVADGILNPSKVSVLALIGSDRLACQIESTEASCDFVTPTPTKGFTPSNTISGATIGGKYENYCCQYPLNFDECSTIDKMESDCEAHGCSVQNQGSNAGGGFFNCVNTGSLNGCASYTSPDSCDYHGCGWDLETSTTPAGCSGTPFACKDFEKPLTGKVYCCNRVPGALSNTYTTGYPHCIEPTNCGGLTQEICSAQNGCFWNLGNPPTTPASCVPLSSALGTGTCN
jgi:hypothetical protein